MLNYDDAKKTQTKQKTPFLPYFALLAEHLFKYPCIQRRALRLLLFQHRLISGMAWEGAECQVSRAKEAARWVHGSYSWGESRRARICSGYRAGGHSGRWCWGVFVPVRVRDGVNTAFLSKGSLSLAGTPAGPRCSLPAPEIPHWQPDPVLCTKARGGDLWTGNAAHWANERTLGGTLLISVYLTSCSTQLRFLACNYGALQTIANWPSVKGSLQTFILCRCSAHTCVWTCLRREEGQP